MNTWKSKAMTNGQSQLIMINNNLHIYVKECIYLHLTIYTSDETTEEIDSKCLLTVIYKIP